MDWERTRRFDDHRGGESYRPGSSRGYTRRSRSPPRIRSPPSRLVADTWAPSTGRPYTRPRTRSPPPYRRRSRSPQLYNRDTGVSSYPKTYVPRRFSPRRDVRVRSPASSSRRPRSPFGEDRTRDAGWNQSTSTCRPPRDSSAAGRDYGHYRKERHPPSAAGRHTRSGSPLRRGLSFENDQRPPTTTRARSPFYRGRRDATTDRYLGQRRRSQSPNDTHTKRPSAPGSMSNSRRSSPSDNKNDTPSRGNRSRSPPVSHLLGRRRSRDWGVSPAQNDPTPLIKSKFTTPEGRINSPSGEQVLGKSLPNTDDTGPPTLLGIQGRSNHAASYPSNAPSQPKAFANKRNYKSPPPGPPHGPKTFASHPSASNISLLSAPTRPRGNSTLKDSGWITTPIRRGPAPAGPHGTPTAPRSSQLPTLGVESQRARSCHHNSVSSTPSSHPPRYSRFLVGLNSIIPGGRLHQLELDNMTEKRLSQLEADRDRLFEQIAESQKLKRAGLRDWDKLDRESSICALKSELAEGHLQCITDTEGTLGRVLF
ncbi:hypothetical protein ASPVEDRAFT_389199 [Aspergillus versicolor CBS 583.65]|uniref:Serine/arginine repetitive matrix protein 1 n=1 Tax=Aspergillus versicolor CBS 583.65 TaxID=1036611 RepID=A0A1L9Q317_ASPVE|nr:uncharacterized protein ASPVEDRAFT_389199 [Aspergillus versicolor CBS 583.65]OJJ08102.1 hypothetical protein ASPVEDRAFT_389199 [Aspergillus versicolor CBS 583.65]